MKRNKSLWLLAAKTVIYLLAALAAYGILFLTAGRLLDRISRDLAGSGGLLAKLAYVYLVDTFIIPATPDLVFTLKNSLSPTLFIMLVSTSSIAGGFTGYLIGRYLGHFSIVKKWSAYYKKKGEKLVNRYGAIAVALAGLTPLPYSTVSWISGMMKINPVYYLLASLTRIPRFAIYYYAIHEGIRLFGTGITR